MLGRGKIFQEILSKNDEAAERADRRHLCVDRIVRTTHPGNCPCGCWLEVGTRNNDIVFLRPAPGKRLGVSTGTCAESWALAAESERLRVRQPMIRGVLLELWERARRRHDDPVKAWRSLVKDDAEVLHWQRARGFGGFQEVRWETAEELIGAALTEAASSAGPSRIFGYSGRPDGDLVAVAAGCRLLHLLGGTVLSSQDWEEGTIAVDRLVWGQEYEQPSVDNWAEARLLVASGPIPEWWFQPLAGHWLGAVEQGAETWSLSDDPDPTQRWASRHLAVSPHQLPAWWIATLYHILEQLDQSVTESAEAAVRDLTDADLLVELLREGETTLPGAYLTGSQVSDNPALASTFLAWDVGHDAPFIVGRGRPREHHTQFPGMASRVSPTAAGETCIVSFPASWGDRTVPVIRLKHLNKGDVLCARARDLLRASVGLAPSHGSATRERPLDARWAEEEFGIPATEIRHFAKVWTETAKVTGGRCLVLSSPRAMGGDLAEAGWVALAACLIFTGCIGRIGGGLHLLGTRQRPLVADTWERLAETKDYRRGQHHRNAAGWFRAVAQREMSELLNQPGGEAETPGERSVLLIWRGDPFFVRNRATGQLVGKVLNPDLDPAGSGKAAPLALVVDSCERLDGTALFSDVLLPVTAAFEKWEVVSHHLTGRLLAARPVRRAPGASKDEWQICSRLARTIQDLAVRHGVSSVGTRSPQNESDANRGITSRDEVRKPHELHVKLDRLLEEYRSFRPAVGEIRVLEDAQQVARCLVETSSAFGGVDRPVRVQPETPAEHEGSDSGTTDIPTARWTELLDRPLRPRTTSWNTGRWDLGIPYVPFWRNVEESVPWCTSSGRQEICRAWLKVIHSTPVRQLSKEVELPSPAGLRVRQTFGSPCPDTRTGSLELLRHIWGPEDPLRLHPEDAERLNLTDGELVVLESLWGACTTVCRLDRAVPRGTGLLYSAAHSLRPGDEWFPLHLGGLFPPFDVSRDDMPTPSKSFGNRRRQENLASARPDEVVVSVRKLREGSFGTASRDQKLRIRCQSPSRRWRGETE